MKRSIDSNSVHITRVNGLEPTLESSEIYYLVHHHIVLHVE